ncbi:MAG: hypothetical protein AABY40_01200 [Nanoarchaeota archaeon]
MPLPIDFFSSFVVPLISLSGITAGFLLFYLAKEEMAAGKKYFILLYRLIFVLLSGIITYILYPLSYDRLILFVFFAIVLLALDLKKHSSYAFYAHYLLFLVGYFLSGKPVIVAAVLFLYGLPVGTLIRIKE